MPLQPRFTAALLLSFASMVPASLAQWTAPTPEELSMTSIPEVPGASAVYLYKEQTTDDSLHMHSYYFRLKVLTEGGKDYANVELPFLGGANGYTVDSIEGRTIHPDGTVIPFTGKPYEKLVLKGAGLKEREKVFTLPSVDVGSIIEYRYKFHFDDDVVWSPDWFIQSNLFLRKAHYMWRPSSRQVMNEKGENISGSVAWAPILPDGVTVKSGHVSSGNSLELTLDVHDIPPVPHEDYMPPMNSLSYRVLFYYTAYRGGSQEFWAHEGKNWAKERDKFIGPNSGVKDYVATLIAATDTPQQKADKLYAALMTFENTDFTRERTTREEHAEGLKEIKNTGDVLARKRGDGDQLAELFVAMARAAGIKAYLAGVADRNNHFFLPFYMSLQQIDDYIAILSIDGKDVLYDPGQRFCEPGHLAWKHALSGGLRQVDGGAEIFRAPPETYKFEHVQRIGDLTLDDHGVASGSVKLTFTGDAALRWRQQGLRGDDTSLNEDLRNSIEDMLPGGMEVRVTDVTGLADYTKPLVVTAEVKGAVGTSTGKRLLVPADIFEVNAKPRFSAPTREIAIDLHYSTYTQDAIRFKLPASLAVESMPDPDKNTMNKIAAYETFSRKAPNSVTTFRNVTIASPFFLATEYADVRTFYTKLETKDQESIVLTRAPQPVTAVVVKPGGE